MAGSAPFHIGVEIAVIQETQPHCQRQDPDSVSASDVPDDSLTRRELRAHQFNGDCETYPPIGSRCTSEPNRVFLFLVFTGPPCVVPIKRHPSGDAARRWFRSISHSYEPWGQRAADRVHAFGEAPVFQQATRDRIHRNSAVPMGYSSNQAQAVPSLLVFAFSARRLFAARPLAFAVLNCADIPGLNCLP